MVSYCVLSLYILEQNWLCNSDGVMYLSGTTMCWIILILGYIEVHISTFILNLAPCSAHHAMISDLHRLIIASAKTRLRGTCLSVSNTRSRCSCFTVALYLLRTLYANIIYIAVLLVTYDGFNDLRNPNEKWRNSLIICE